MTMSNRGWGKRLWLCGAVAGVVSLASAGAQAGIDGSGRLKANGIDGSGLVKANGIDGSGRLKANGIDGSGLVKASSLDVLGVVEGSDAASGTVTVSGQTVRLSAKTQLTGGASPAKGALVAVYGAVNADGTIAAAQVSVLQAEYVSGATTLYVRGVVKSVNAAVATAKVGNLTVDYSSSLYSGSSSIAVGSIAEFSGLQTSSATLYASKAGSPAQ